MRCLYTHQDLVKKVKRGWRGDESVKKDQIKGVYTEQSPYISEKQSYFPRTEGPQIVEEREREKKKLCL